MNKQINTLLDKPIVALGLIAALFVTMTYVYLQIMLW